MDLFSTEIARKEKKKTERGRVFAQTTQHRLPVALPPLVPFFLLQLCVFFFLSLVNPRPHFDKRKGARTSDEEQKRGDKLTTRKVYPSRSRAGKRNLRLAAHEKRMSGSGFGHPKGKETSAWCLSRRHRHHLTKGADRRGQRHFFFFVCWERGAIMMIGTQTHKMEVFFFFCLYRRGTFFSNERVARTQENPGCVMLLRVTFEWCFFSAKIAGACHQLKVTRNMLCFFFRSASTPLRWSIGRLNPF
jgi:hypothetical protein